MLAEQLTNIGPVVNDFDRGEAAHAGSHSDDACREDGGNTNDVPRLQLQALEQWERKTEDCGLVNKCLSQRCTKS